MLEGLITGLLWAWILTIFNFNEVITGALKELLNREITDNTYYFIFAIIGVMCGWKL